jgi:hypothetical protein
MDHFGNAVRHTEANSAGLAGSSLRHNKSGRDRSSRRSQPAADSPRRGTAALTLPRHGTPIRLVDERHDCQDIGSAYVPRHGVGHGVEPNRQVQISAPCLPLDTDKPTPGQPAVVFIGARVATNATPITPSISDTPPDVSNLERPTSPQTVTRRAPARRGSGQLSTPTWAVTFLACVVADATPQCSIPRPVLQQPQGPLRPAFGGLRTGQGDQLGLGDAVENAPPSGVWGLFAAQTRLRSLPRAGGAGVSAIRSTTWCSRAVTIRRSHQPPPASEISALSRMRALRTWVAGCLPVRMNASSASRSASLSRTTYVLSPFSNVITWGTRPHHLPTPCQQSVRIS